MDNKTNVEDFWSDVFNIAYGGYNSEIDYDIYSVSKLIIKENKFIVEISENLKLSINYVELILYILASVKYDGKSVFEYGTSPRCLFVLDKEIADKFLSDFEKYIEKHWNEKD